MNNRGQAITTFQDEIPNFVPSETSVSILNPRHSNVRVSQPSSDWILQLKDRFNELMSLSNGWDGYVGVPVSYNCIIFATNLIDRLCVKNVPAPQLVPGSDGTLQIEWHLNQFDIEIDVLGFFDVVAMRYDHISGLEEEIELETDFSVLFEWIVELGQNRLNQQQVEG